MLFRSKIATEGEVYSSPAFGPYGLVVVGSHDKKLHVYRIVPGDASKLEKKEESGKTGNATTPRKGRNKKKGGVNHESPSWNFYFSFFYE